TLDRHRRLVEARNPAVEYRPAEPVQEGGPESVPLMRVEQPSQDPGVRALVLESDDLEEVHLGTLKPVSLGPDSRSFAHHYANPPSAARARRPSRSFHAFRHPSRWLFRQTLKQSAACDRPIRPVPSALSFTVAEALSKDRLFLLILVPTCAKG